VLGNWLKICILCLPLKWELNW